MLAPASNVSTPEVVLRLADPERRFRSVRLVSELFKREPPPSFVRRSGGRSWELRLALPDVDRLEYELLAVTVDGRVELLLDPEASVVSGPFGAKSSLELPAYRRPAWLDADQLPGEVEPLRLRSETLGRDVEGLLWRPAGTAPGERLPLLVVHDGPEYAAHSALLPYLAAAIAAGDAPPVRAALLAPPSRDEHYGASRRYAAALVEDLLPALPRSGPVAGLGASLGALALLHAHRLYPAVFASLFLQSGSFFQPSTDTWEAGHPRFGPITRFVARVLAGRERSDPIPVTLTCGAAEENLQNNHAVRDALGRQGYEAELVLVRDAHNWVAWRDGLHPHLARLLGLLRR
jgi:enterochelin esterase-like enzyme